jgi:hypothetical protein
VLVAASILAIGLLLLRRAAVHGQKELYRAAPGVTADGGACASILFYCSPRYAQRRSVFWATAAAATTFAYPPLPLPLAPARRRTRSVEDRAAVPARRSTASGGAVRVRSRGSRVLSRPAARAQVKSNAARMDGSLRRAEGSGNFRPDIPLRSRLGAPEGRCVRNPSAATAFRS